MATQPGWELFRTLLAVVKEGSLSAAARTLDLTQPTVGRHIDALEKHLDVALFTRSQSGLRPTDAALALLPDATKMATAAEALLRTASGGETEERGAVRITASEIIGVEIVTPLLVPFREAHPKISVELTLTSRTDDLIHREADIAVRLFRPTQAALVARKLGALEYGLFAHPRYVKRHGNPRTERELEGHALVGFDSEALVERARARGSPFGRDALSYRCDSYVAQHAALKEGLGIGNAAFVLAERDGLVRVLVDEPVVTAPVWLAMHEALRTTRRVRLLFEHLAGAIARFLVSSRSGSRASATTRSRPSAGHPRGGGSRGGRSGGSR